MIRAAALGTPYVVQLMPVGVLYVEKGRIYAEEGNGPWVSQWPTWRSCEQSPRDFVDAVCAIAARCTPNEDNRSPVAFDNSFHEPNDVIKHTCGTFVGSPCLLLLADFEECAPFPVPIRIPNVCRSEPLLPPIQRSYWPPSDAGIPASSGINPQRRV